MLEACPWPLEATPVLLEVVSFWGGRLTPVLLEVDPPGGGLLVGRLAPVLLEAALPALLPSRVVGRVWERSPV